MKTEVLKKLSAKSMIPEETLELEHGINLSTLGRITCETMSSNKENTCPELLAVLLNNHLYCWCKYCNDWHVHGDVGGHKAAHCLVGTGSPYEKSGYTIKEFAY